LSPPDETKTRNTSTHPILKGKSVKITQTILTLTLLLCTAWAGAETGERYEDSIRKYGNPIGKLIRSNQVVYLFKNNTETIRQEYDLEGNCTKSELIGDQFPSVDNIDSGYEIETGKGLKISITPTLLALIAILSIAAVLIVILSKKIRNNQFETGQQKPTTLNCQ
jgi:hypothetical protein